MKTINKIQMEMNTNTNIYTIRLEIYNTNGENIHVPRYCTCYLLFCDGDIFSAHALTAYTLLVHVYRENLVNVASNYIFFILQVNIT